MIVRMKQIFEEVARENSWPITVVESVGVDVFSTLRSKLNEPTEIGYELPKLGTFTLKHNKYASFHEYLLNAINDGTYVVGENYSEEMFERNKILMSKIEAFRNEKAEKTRLKNEAKAIKSGQTNLEEH